VHSDSLHAASSMRYMCHTQQYQGLSLVLLKPPGLLSLGEPRRWLLLLHYVVPRHGDPRQLLGHQRGGNARGPPRFRGLRSRRPTLQLES